METLHFYDDKKGKECKVLTKKIKNYVPLCGDLQAVLLVAVCLLVFCTGSVLFAFSFFVSLE